MRSIQQHEIQRAFERTGRDGSHGLALDEVHRFVPEIGMIAQTGDGAVDPFDGEGGVMLAEARQENGAAAATRLSGKLKRSAPCDRVKRRGSHRVPRMELKGAGNQPGIELVRGLVRHGFRQLFHAGASGPATGNSSTGGAIGLLC